MSKIKKRGRKPKHTVEVLKTMVWVEYAKQQADKGTTSVEVYIRGRPLQPLEKISKWYRYKNGINTPIPEYISQVESVIPGSKAIFEHVLWDVLFTFERSQDEINGLIQKLQPKVKNLLINDLNKNPVKRKRFNESTVKMLIDLGTVDCLVVAVLMVQESIFLGSEKLRELALELYLGLTEKIAQNPLFFKIHPELFNYMDMSFKHYIFLVPNIRLDTVIFWQFYRDNFWSEELKKKSQILEQTKKVAPKIKITPKTQIESLDGNSYFDS